MLHLFHIVCLPPACTLFIAFCVVYVPLLSTATLVLQPCACMVLDTDNLQISDDFLDFPVQADADIHTDTLRFSARFRCDFPHNSTMIFRMILYGNNLGRIPDGIMRKMANPAGTYVRSYVQCLYVHSQHTSHKRGMT